MVTIEQIIEQPNFKFKEFYVQSIIKITTLQNQDVY